jgi:hypothetical protein
VLGQLSVDLHGLDDLGSIPGWNRDLSLRQRIQAGSMAHRAYQTGTTGSFLGIKVAGA